MKAFFLLPFHIYFVPTASVKTAVSSGVCEPEEAALIKRP